MEINIDLLFAILILYMSFIYFGNTPASVPPVFDTTPCMKEMLNYEDCVYEYPYSNVVQMCQTPRWSIPHGLSCGHVCWLTARPLSMTPKSSCTKPPTTISSCDPWPRKANSSCGSARRRGSFSRPVSGKCQAWRGATSTPAGILPLFPTCNSRDIAKYRIHIDRSIQFNFLVEVINLFVLNVQIKGG